MWALLTYFLSFFKTQKIESPAGKPSVAIIGCGCSGICAFIKVKQELGVEATIFDSSDEVGGVWAVNQYPGCEVDAPSQIYTYSFEPNPHWTQFWASQEEVLNYFKRIAVKYGIYKQTLFKTTVTRVTWIDLQSQWKVEFRRGDSKKVESRHYDFLFTALGPVSHVAIPEEYKSFEGPIIHSARWDKSLSFEGKTVAVVGNGSSAIQIIPELQKKAGKLISYQRSPIWIFPKPKLQYGPWTKKLFSLFPFLMLIQHYFFFIVYELVYPLLMKNYESWGAKWMVKYGTESMRKFLTEKGRQDLIKILIPDYPIGCKLFGLSTTYLGALCSDNVEVKMGKIEGIKGRTVFHSDGSAQTVDILVLGTGFTTRTYFNSFEVVGQNGVSLNKKWSQEYPATFHGIHIPGCPNFYVLFGPNSIVITAATIIAQVQVGIAIRAMKYILKNKLKALEVKKEASEKWTQSIRTELNGKTVFSRNCTSWWKTKDGEIVGMYPGTLTNFWYTARWPKYSKDFIAYPQNE